MLGSLSAVIGQAGYAVSLAFAARLGEGAVTFYSYAFFAAMMVMGATAIPAGTVLVAPLSESWQQKTELLERPMIEVIRAGLTLMAPLPALAIVIGPEAASFILGETISVGDGREIVVLTLALGGMTIASLLGAVPLIAAFSARRYGAIARASLISMVVHVIASAVGVALDDLTIIALATSTSALAYLISVLISVYGREAWSILRRMAREVAHVGAASAVSFAPAFALAATDAKPGVSVLGWVLGCVALAIVLRTRLPDHWELLLRFRYMLRRGTATTG
jgi:peptidoglycan biosynthesis protein MviN/MurJ (putative lipid II flippase)